jgi:hypothetical protein
MLARGSQRGELNILSPLFTHVWTVWYTHAWHAYLIFQRVIPKIPKSILALRRKNMVDSVGLYCTKKLFAFGLYRKLCHIELYTENQSA